MKRSGSCSAIYFFACIFVVAAYMVDTSLSSQWCELYNKFGIYGCSVNTKIYPIYKTLENIVTNDSETLFLMRQAFFPGLVPHVLETEKDDFVLIRVCAIYDKTMPPPACHGIDVNSTLTETRCWNYRWSSSPAMNMVDVGQLLAFDPVSTSIIYSRFVDAPTDRRFLLIFNISLEAFSCAPSTDELMQATILLSTWSKAYAKAQGVPSKWKKKDQGYIATWYSYYIAEACYGDEMERQSIRLLFLIIFVLLNALIVITIATNRMLLYSKFCKFFDDRSQPVSNIYGAAGMTMIFITPGYLISTALLYKHETTPNVFRAECNATTPYMDCSPPHDSHLCQDETLAFIIKIIIFSIAIIVEMVIAGLTVKNDTENRNRFDAKCLNQLVKISKTYLLWNAFMFIQIMAGLVSLPVCTFLLITPLQTIPVLCAGILYFSLAAVFFLGLLQLCGKSKLKMLCIYALFYFISVALAVALSQLYFSLSSPQSTYAAVFFTLLPPIALSVITWVLKRKFLSGDSIKNKEKSEPLLQNAGKEEGGEQHAE